VNVLTDTDDHAERERRLRPAIEEIFRLAVSLGGTITGEHGVGCAQSRWLPLCRDAASIDAMRAIKAALDPRGILNPGKVLPGEPVPPPVGRAEPVPRRG
jgi:FAD/FMN-containing dehydrogenase